MIVYDLFLLANESLLEIKIYKTDQLSSPEDPPFQGGHCRTDGQFFLFSPPTKVCNAQPKEKSC